MASIVKMLSVNNIRQYSNYILQDEKTDTNLVSFYKCHSQSITEDFNKLYEDRQKFLNRNTVNKARSIIQSFGADEDLSPMEVHLLGKELADKYLKGKHQYIVVTHLDSNNYHNHILFNNVEIDSLKMFNSKRESLKRLHNTHGKIVKEHGISLLDIQKEEHNFRKESNEKYYSHREYVARAKGNSYLNKLEEDIDRYIFEANSYEQFLLLMNNAGYEFKDNKHLGFKDKENDRFTRTYRLGLHYNKRSIQYRIENKDFKIAKSNFDLQNKWFDKSEAKFQENLGLKNWASSQNLIYLQELSDLVINQGYKLEDIIESQRIKENIHGKFNKKVQELDDSIHELEKLSLAFVDYADSYTLIQEYKKSSDKEQFKKDNYRRFKKFDNAKRNMNTLKSKYNIHNQKALDDLLKEYKSERDNVYKDLNKEIKKTRDDINR